jgi:hypothetical protein
MDLFNLPLSEAFQQLLQLAQSLEDLTTQGQEDISTYIWALHSIHQ